MERVRVLTLNVWNKSGPWAKRLPLLRRELSQLSPDIVGLQEVLRLGQGGSAEADQALEIAEGLGYHIAYGAAADYGRGLMFGNAVLSRHPIARRDVFPLPGVESGESRSLLYALVETPAGRLPVFVTHLNWKLHHANVRLSQVQHIVKHVFELAPIDDAELPPVLMGDFNAEPDSDEMRYLRGLSVQQGRSVYFADAWLYAGNGPGYTFDRRNGFAALAHEPPRRIDYIYVRGPDRKFRGEPLACRVCFAEPELQAEGEIWPSDHFGVLAEIQVAPRDR